MASVPMPGQPPGAIACAGAGQGAPPDGWEPMCTHPVSIVTHGVPPMDPTPQAGDPTGILWGGQGVPIPMLPQLPDGVSWGEHGITPIAPGLHPPVGRLWLVLDGVPVP